MEIEGQEVVQDDQMSNCRSFGSNYHPSSQSRKISIGVMIDSLANIRSGGMKDAEVAVLNAEKATSSRERKKQEQGFAAVTTSKQNEAPEQESSPWINTKSVYKKRPTIETVYSKQTSNLHYGGGRENKVNGANETPKTSSIQFFANQNSMLQSGYENRKKFNRVTDRSSRGKDRTTEMEKFPSSSGQGVGASDKGGTVDKINKTERRSEALKMKLWEVLGNVSSPNKQFLSGSKTPEIDANSSKVVPNFDQQENTIAKLRQNSDSIEPDSESPDATRRPVTRSLTRKRAPARVQAKKVKIGPSSCCKQKLKEKSIFSFKVGLSGELHDAVNGVLQKSKKKGERKKGERKKGERKSCPIGPRKIWIPEKNNADRVKSANYGSKVVPPSEKASLLGNSKENFQSRPPQNNEDHVELKNRDQEKDFHSSPVTKKADEVGDVDSPESADGQEDLSNPPLNILEDLQDLHSPTFQMRTPIINSSPHSTPRTDGMEQGVCSPVAAERIFTFRTLPTPKRNCYGSKMQSESFDDAEELRVCPTPTKKYVPIAGEKDARNESSKSSSEERDSDCYKEISSTDEGCHSSQETDIASPENVTAETPKFIHPAKRLRSHGGIKFNDFNPALLFPRGTEGRTEFQCCSEQSQEDGLSRAISLFSLALERIKCKMERETSKRSSEIAMSVAEGIQLQLQNVQSQMQKDVGKLTSLSKLKRKRVETRFQEQQEQLKLIHEKFKDEINQHMQDCRGSIEGLEVHQIELQRNLERQKASHQKLLLQVEEAIEIQLNDAQQRIAAIHKMARQKMLQLKLVLGECLKDGIVS